MGALECQSHNDSLTVWDAVAALHAAASPDCDAQHKDGGIRMSTWRPKQGKKQNKEEADPCQKTAETAQPVLW